MMLTTLELLFFLH